MSGTRDSTPKLSHKCLNNNIQLEQKKIKEKWRIIINFHAVKQCNSAPCSNFQYSERVRSPLFFIVLNADFELISSFTSICSFVWRARFFLFFFTLFDFDRCLNTIIHNFLFATTDTYFVLYCA